jgi:hypothetical protein
MLNWRAERYLLNIARGAADPPADCSQMRRDLIPRLQNEFRVLLVVPIWLT